MTKSVAVGSPVRALDVVLEAAKSSVAKDGSIDLDALSEKVPGSDAGACAVFDRIILADEFQRMTRVSTPSLSDMERTTRTTIEPRNPDFLTKDEVPRVLGALIAAKARVHELDHLKNDRRPGSDGAISHLEAALAANRSSEGLADGLALAAVAGVTQAEIDRAGLGSRMLLGVAQADAAFRAATMPDGRVDLLALEKSLSLLPTEPWITELLSDVKLGYARQEMRLKSDSIGLVEDWFGVPATELTKSQRKSVLDGLASASTVIKAVVDADGGIALSDLRRISRDAFLNGEGWGDAVVVLATRGHIPRSPLLDQISREREL